MMWDPPVKHHGVIVGVGVRVLAGVLVTRRGMLVAVVVGVPVLNGVRVAVDVPVGKGGRVDLWVGVGVWVTVKVWLPVDV